MSARVNVLEYPFKIRGGKADSPRLLRSLSRASISRDTILHLFPQFDGNLLFSNVNRVVLRLPFR